VFWFVLRVAFVYDWVFLTESLGVTMVLCFFERLILIMNKKSFKALDIETMF